MQLTTTPPTPEQVRAVVAAVGVAGPVAKLKIALYVALPAAVVAPLAVQVQPTQLSWRGVSLARSRDFAVDAVTLALAGREDDDLFLVPDAQPSSWMRQRWSGTRLYLFGPEIFQKSVELTEPLDDDEIDSLIFMIRSDIEPPAVLTPNSGVGRMLRVSGRGLAWNVVVEPIR